MAGAGFPSGALCTPVPNLVLSSLLEEITDPAELKCTLRAFLLLREKKSNARYLTADEFITDPVLYRSFESPGLRADETILRGLQQGVERGTFLCCRIGEGPKPQEAYVLNDAPGRRTLKTLQRDGAGGGGLQDTRRVPPSGPADQPNIFQLYEENIGLLTPLVAEQLKKAEEDYTERWIKEAFEVACVNNKRNWRYIEAVLKRWSVEGKGDGKPERHTAKVGFSEHRKKRGPSSPRY